METGLRGWLPVALCCVPLLAIAAIVGIGIVIGGASFEASLGGPVGLGLIVVALLACPVTMSWMMWRAQMRRVASGRSGVLADCCLPEQPVSPDEPGPAERLQALRARREAVEAEIAAVSRLTEREASHVAPSYEKGRASQADLPYGRQ